MAPQKVVTLTVVGPGLLRTGRHGYCSRSPESGVSAGPSANGQEEPTTALPRQQLAEAELIVTANIAAHADPPARLAAAHPRRRTPDHAPVSVTRHRRVSRGPTAPCRAPHGRRHGHSSIEQQSFNEDRLHPVRHIAVIEGAVPRQLLLRPLALFRGRGSGSTHAGVAGHGRRTRLRRRPCMPTAPTGCDMPPLAQSARWSGWQCQAVRVDHCRARSPVRKGR